MGSLDAVIDEAESRFGLSNTKATSLLSGLLGYIHTSGGPSGLLDHFRNVGLGDTATSWLSGESKPLSGEKIRAAIGNDSLNNLASRAGVSVSTAAAAIAFFIPKLIQRMAPGGVLPAQLPSEFSSYMAGPTGAIASGARQAADYATERVQRSGGSRFLWPLLGLLAVLVIGYWAWNRGRVVPHPATGAVAYDASDLVRSANEKASAALAALKPGFSSNDLVDALNLEIINFPTGSAEIPSESAAVLDGAAIAMKKAPQNTRIEIQGHTDSQGDPASNMALSQQRADAVRNYLVGHGADASMLVAKGYGDTKPVASNDSDEGKFRNRRIEFVSIQ